MNRISRHSPAHKAALIVAAATATIALAACDDETGGGSSEVKVRNASNSNVDSNCAAGWERVPFWCRGGSGATGGQPAAAGVGEWTGEQVTNAHLIAQVGREMGVPRRGIVIAIATAMQESSLLVDPPGRDHDSVGLFQQRPSQGWGSWSECHDPRHSAQSFYRALLRVSGWESMRLTRAAQAVQISAYPEAYAKHEAAADRLAG